MKLLVILCFVSLSLVTSLLLLYDAQCFFGRAGQVFSESPIAINTKKTVQLPSPTNLILVNYCDSEFTNVKVVNTGHTIKATFPELQKLPMLKGGPLKEQYTFEQVHFHWSDRDDSGSEHSIDGRKFASEAHFVHYNTKYESFEGAKDKSDGLLVIGLMLQITDKDNTKFEPLITALRKIQAGASEHVFSARCFFSWMEDTNVNEYVIYNGSLTTPPFSKNVIWIVMMQPISISKTQIQVIRSMKIHDDHHKTVTNNVRALQNPPNGHTVQYTGKQQKK